MARCLGPGPSAGPRGDPAGPAAPCTRAPPRRAWYKGKKRIGKVRGPDGQIHHEPDAIARALWDSRADVWRAGWAGGEAARAMLELAPADLASGTPTAPPGICTLRRLVLAARGSAPGHNGIPYEALHPGCQFVACLVAQAFWAAAESDEAVQAVLSDNVEVLIWIPKKEGGPAPDSQRPSCSPRASGGLPSQPRRRS